MTRSTSKVLDDPRDERDGQSAEERERESVPQDLPIVFEELFERMIARRSGTRSAAVVIRRPTLMLSVGAATVRLRFRHVFRRVHHNAGARQEFLISAQIIKRRHAESYNQRR